MTSVISGGEPIDIAGGEIGVLVIHGLTSTPQSMSLLAGAFGAAGFTVLAPLLPGHGTAVEDLAATTWIDWTRAASNALTSLRSRCDRVVVAGLSMGGTITAWLAARHPELSGIVLINAPLAPVIPPEMVEATRGALALGIHFAPGSGSDIADATAVEIAYEQTSLAAALSLNDLLDQVATDLPLITCPVLLITSVNDHAVPAAAVRASAQQIKGNVTELLLPRSFHVATMDVEHADLERHAVQFVQEVTTLCDPGSRSRMPRSRVG